jgi:hypothetical protein
MLKESDNRTLKLEQGDIHARVRGVLTAVIWKEKRDMYILTNVNEPPVEFSVMNVGELINLLFKKSTVS